MYIRALSFADIHVVKRKALKKVLGFYTDYAASFDKELRLAVNICEVQHFKKIKRRKRGTSEEVAVPGISRLIGQFQNNQKGREKEKKLGRRSTQLRPVCTAPLLCIPYAEYPTDGAYQSKCAISVLYVFL